MPNVLNVNVQLRHHPSPIPACDLASTTHSQLDDASKIKAGAGPDIVRLSIGIEDKEDLIADLDQALSS